MDLCRTAENNVAVGVISASKLERSALSPRTVDNEGSAGVTSGSLREYQGTPSLAEGKPRLRKKWFAQEPAIIPRKTLRGHREWDKNVNCSLVFVAKPQTSLNVPW